MRMWMIDPKLLCNRHLLGEHGEIHKHMPSFRKGHNVSGRFKPIVQIQLNAIEMRHDELASEMLSRGMKHQSPLIDVPDLRKTYPNYFDFEVDLEQSKQDLCSRCLKCKNRIYPERS